MKVGYSQDRILLSANGFVRKELSVNYLKLLCLIALMVSSSGLGFGQTRDHGDGFFLRLSAGPGFAKTKLTAGNQSMKLSGETGDLNLAIGGIISPNLALHGTLYGWLMQNPDVEASGFSVQTRGDLDLSAVGVGFTYYFMLSNIYVSGSAGIGKLSVQGEGNVGETKQGPVLDLTVGKEWWVGDSWGLGMAAGFIYHSVPERNVSGDWSGLSITVRFSATLN